jgi:hypothetical protein
MKYSSLKFIILIFLFLLYGRTKVVAAQSDTVKVQQAIVKPEVDGVGNDQSWNGSGVNWQPIDQLWMPWKGSYPSVSDFTGKYKVIWSKSSNMLYFLVDITDDVFIDGYDFATGGPFGYPNYDVVEIFLDENRSKGAHVFDNGTENAQNAFSYHISVNAPAEGETTTEFTVEDLDGSDWGHSWVVNYSPHFPEFAMKKTGTNYVYEFALKIFDDTYPTQQHNGSTTLDPQKSRVILAAGKIMGMTMAYCDNDANDGKRDNFFGSTPGKEYTANFGFSGTQNSISTEDGKQIFNTCWMSANDYGVLKLIDVITSAGSSVNTIDKQQVTVWPTKTSDNFNINILSADIGIVNIELFDLKGRKLLDISEAKNSPSQSFLVNIQSLKKGIYFISVTMGNNISRQKLIKL